MPTIVRLHLFHCSDYLQRLIHTLIRYMHVFVTRVGIEIDTVYVHGDLSYSTLSLSDYEYNIRIN